ncbi:DUF7687 domain-containing protein [Azomonas macrocytogenes]|uniref:Uncharacterized protein n=1 Tax=Azomonas macrocytogenes TaxID=69962 RepID=A0A839T932_AZOMA|nr:hypothetical protein [Azomonas macrocytogenes]MBB3105390.1 hypothetical protein [Azomonas macrocytogenes]
MRGSERWLSLGWRHPLWDLHRFYLSLSKQKAFQQAWLEELRSKRAIELPDGSELPIEAQLVDLFFEYQEERKIQLLKAESFLRTEAEALAFCESKNEAVRRTRTKNADHHQSSKAMIAAVSAVAREVSNKHGTTANLDPQTRCVWCSTNDLHVSARNLDGAIPGLANPLIVWEIKEYWGQTKGGSKMSDAVYECHLVGMELREFESKSGISINHIVFVDGKEQWSVRKSDLRRFIDLLNQGLIDYLIIGREVEEEWEIVLDNLLSSSSVRQ